jgi:hypothetical protein
VHCGGVEDPETLGCVASRIFITGGLGLPPQSVQVT